MAASPTSPAAPAPVIGTVWKAGSSCKGSSAATVARSTAIGAPVIGNNARYVGLTRLPSGGRHATTWRTPRSRDRPRVFHAFPRGREELRGRTGGARTRRRRQRRGGRGAQVHCRAL